MFIVRTNYLYRLMISHPLSHYDYHLPDENLGKMPVEPRDHARLFVYDTAQDTIYFDHFYHLHNYLPDYALIIMNNTGVIPARVYFTKDTGGKVEGLVLINEGIQPDGTIPVIVNKKLEAGRKVYIESYEFLIERQDFQYFYLKPQFDTSELTDILEKFGTTPTPKYLGKIDLNESQLRSRYQTIFANRKKSVAAPTASLHFTEQSFQKLEEKHIDRAEVTLDVGMGTFAEVSQKQYDEKKLHTEPVWIMSGTAAKIREAKRNKNALIAVGTTAIRCIESQADKLLDDSYLEDIYADTNLFIHPGFEFRIADILITNFHTPKSSLMSLVDAFLQQKKALKGIVSLYEIAVKEGFRFYSFGDSMLII